MDPLLKGEELEKMCGEESQEEEEGEGGGGEGETPRQRALPSFIKKEMASR